MRIGVVYIGTARGSTLAAMAERMAEGMRSLGHNVETLDAASEDPRRMATYEYVAVGTEAAGFFGGKLPKRVGEFLSMSPGLGGKRCLAWVRKGGFSPQKTLSNLMRAMEKEGMCVNWSEIVSGADAAEAVGKRIGA